jgi:hypothetical protein
MKQPTGRRIAGLRIAGGALVAASVLGYATVADDLRHVGELGVVTSALLGGIALVVASYATKVK